ncbi:hypothetical protein EDC01DRAFT_630554 [Geopyxis carbonaria]|nr:hypothetical protein EDC01DRAFT_630554 [Geopyxis carbonaria]
MSDIPPFLAIPPHMRHYLRPQQEKSDETGEATHNTLPQGSDQRAPTDVLPPSLGEGFDPFTQTAGVLDFTDDPPLITVNLSNPTPLDFFDPSGIVPSYSTLLTAMDYVCGTTVWVQYEDFLLGKGFGFEFWVVVSANTNQHLGLRRAELLEKLTSGDIKRDMVGEVVENWEFVWRLAAWLTDGGEWEDVGPVRELMGTD